jgi:hypothetical protein
MFALSLALGVITVFIYLGLATFRQPRLLDWLTGALAIFGGAFGLMAGSTILTVVLKAIVRLFT